jgi:hypothetical protein
VSTITISGDIAGLTILAAKNGWVVVQSDRFGAMQLMPVQMVAETSEMLAAIVTDWAKNCEAVRAEPPQ